MTSSTEERRPSAGCNMDRMLVTSYTSLGRICSASRVKSIAMM